MRSNHGLTRLSYSRIRLNLHLIRKKQEYKTPMQQINPKQVRHEAQFRIELQDLAHSFRCRYRMARAFYERRGSGPVVQIIQHGNWVPFSVQEDVENVQDVCGVGDDDFPP